MADKTDPQTDPQTDPEPQEPDQEAFWTRFQAETAKVVDARLAERDKKRADKTKAAGQRRSNERRATIPAIIADIVFGKDS